MLPSRLCAYDRVTRGRPVAARWEQAPSSRFRMGIVSTAAKHPLPQAPWGLRSLALVIARGRLVRLARPRSEASSTIYEWGQFQYSRPPSEQAREPPAKLKICASLLPSALAGRGTAQYTGSRPAPLLRRGGCLARCGQIGARSALQLFSIPVVAGFSPNRAAAAAKPRKAPSSVRSS